MRFQEIIQEDYNCFSLVLRQRVEKRGIETCDVQWHTQEFFSGGGSTNSDEDRGQSERGSGGGSPLVRGSGGSYNLVQEISFHMVTFSSFLVL